MVTRIVLTFDPGGVVRAEVGEIVQVDQVHALVDVLRSYEFKVTGRAPTTTGGEL